MSEPERDQPGRGVDLIAAAIPRLLCWRAVVSQPVRLDDETELWPEEVDAKAIDADACLRHRQSGTPDQQEEPALELRVRQAERAPIEEAAQNGNAGLTGHVVKRSPQPLGVDEIVLVCLVHRRLQLFRGETSGQVRHGSRWVRNRDARSNRTIAVGEPAAAVDSDATRAASGSRRHRHFDRSTRRLPDSPELRCALMAEEGARAAGQHRGHPTLEAPDFASSNNEDPAMKAAESAGRKAVVYCAVGEAKLAELSARDDAVLPSGKSPGPARLLVTLPRYSVEK
jgi:hypothetical protein